MAYWLTRDEGGSTAVELWRGKPRADKDLFGDGIYGAPNASSLSYFCPAELKKVTGITLKSGEIRRVKSINIVLED